MNTECLSLCVKCSDSEFLKRNILFKFAIINGDYCVTNFKDEFLFRIEPQSSDSNTLAELRNISGNYALFPDINKQTREAVIDIYPVFDVRCMEQFSILSNTPLNKGVKILNASESTALVLFHNIYDSEEKSFFVESEVPNKYYKIYQKKEFVKSSEDRACYYYEIEENPKTIKKMNAYQKILVLGKVEISDKKSYLSDEDRYELNRIKADVQNYLNLWNKYNEIELKKEFERFKRFGLIRYDYIDYGDDIKLFFSEENFARIGNDFKDKLITVGNKFIVELLNCTSFDQYEVIERGLLKNGAVTVAYISGEPNKVERCIKVKTGTRDFFHNHGGAGYIGLSLLGNRIAYNRREVAKEKIITGKAGISKLYTLFTDNPEPSPITEHVSIDNRLIKNDRLTSNQLEAISIICNTPDIAIIQGPPGTGKTTTIREAITQLNCGKEGKQQFSDTLLSGFRHETVLNMLDDVELFGLPAIKVGNKADDGDSKDIEPKIIKFIDDLINRLLEKYKDLSDEDAEYIEFKKKYYNYARFNNSIDDSIAILNDVKNLDRFKYDVGVCEKIDSLIKSLQKSGGKKSYEEKMLVDFLYTLPLSAKAFEDDKERINIELSILKEKELIKESVIRLQMVLKGEFNPEEVRKVRRELILMHRQQPPIIATAQDKGKVVDYLDSLFDMIKCERYKKFDGEKVAILDYIDSLTENPKLIRDTIMEYTKVLGATNQQSLSKDMYSIKQQDEIYFENVIIDEAATSSPLDLFIPMSQGKRRVVLIGDHRQLPNITNEEIIDEVSAELKISSEEQKNRISQEMKTTLFQILFEKAKRLEEKDGIKRVITLNSQFRMHPELGNIVSEFFYKQDGGIKSPRPASDFSHNYSGLTDKYLYWIDVPFDSKSEYRRRGSTSRINILEAERIAKHIFDAFERDDYVKQTIGIITAYKDQVEEIQSSLQAVGILDEHNNMTTKYIGQEILVGTVDAFQGREFDVVYLSLAYAVNDIYREKRPYSRYAGEASKSLLCVAMSRQRKMLIIVGDHKLYLDELCQEKVPALYEVASRCNERGMNE